MDKKVNNSMKTFSMTDVGQVRQLNQDYLYTSEAPVGNLDNLFIVADGMGGHKAGDYASKFTVEHVVELIRNSKETEPVRIIEEAVEEANRQLLQKAEDPELSGMGTTLVLCTIRDGDAYIANVGDSRLYIIDSTIRQITHDHSLVEEMVRRGELEPENARLHPNKNIITRAIGAGDEVKIDFFQISLEKESMILMCSDGLTNMVDDEDIKFIVDRQRDVVEITESLIRAANDNGGRDNIAIIVIEPFADEVKEC